MFKIKIRNRIDEIDTFYEDNYTNPKIVYFEKFKIRLRSLLSPSIDVNYDIHEEIAKLFKFI